MHTPVRRPAAHVHLTVPQAEHRVSNGAATHDSILTGPPWLARIARPAGMVLFWLSGPLIALAVTNQWFYPGRLLARGDTFPTTFINPGYWAQRVPYTWDSLTSLGAPSDLQRFLPQVWVNQLLHVVLAPAQTQHLFYAALLGGQFSAMQYFTLTIFPGRRVAAYLAALFYCFNPFIVIMWPNPVFMFLLAFLPYLSALLIKILTMPWSTPRLAVFVVLASQSGFLFQNPPTFALFLGFILLLVAFILLRYHTHLRSISCQLALITVLGLMANAYWLVPSYSMVFGANHPQVSVVTNAQDWGWVASRSSILNLFWLNPTWAWNYTFYYPYAPLYQTPLLLLTIFLPTLLAFSALLNRTLPRHIVLPSTALALALLLVSTGVHGAWQSINLFLSRHVPLFWLFREPDDKFPLLILVLYAPLIGYQAEWLAGRIGVVLRKWPSAALSSQGGVAAVLGSIFLITAFPLVTGAVVGRGYVTAPSAIGIAIPAYWFQAGAYLQRHFPRVRVLVLPFSDSIYTGYSWGFYGAEVLADELIANPEGLGSGTGYQSSAPSNAIMAWQALESNGRRVLVPYLASEGVGLILQRNDVDTTLPGRHILHPQQMRAYLQSQPGIRFLRSFGKLDLYRVDPQYYVAPVYAVQLPVATRAMPPSERRRAVDEALTAALGLPSAAQQRHGMRHLQPAHVIRVAWTQVNPTRWVVRFGAVTGPVVLVSSTTYHPGWHACIAPLHAVVPPWFCWFNGFAPSSIHVAALGFANGWIIDRPAYTEVILDYSFQHIADICLWLSVLTVAAALAAGVWSLRSLWPARSRQQSQAA